MIRIKNRKFFLYILIMTIAIINASLTFFYTQKKQIIETDIPLKLEQVQKAFEQLSDGANASFSFLSLLNNNIILDTRQFSKMPPIYNPIYNEFGLNRTDNDQTDIIKGSIFGIGDFNSFTKQKKDRIFYALAWMNLLSISIVDLYHINDVTLLKHLFFYSNEGYRITLNERISLINKPFKEPSALTHPAINEQKTATLLPVNYTWISTPYYDQSNQPVIAINRLLSVKDDINEYITFELNINIIYQLLEKMRLDNKGIVSLHYQIKNTNTVILNYPKNIIKKEFNNLLRIKNYITFSEVEHSINDQLHLYVHYHLTPKELFLLTLKRSHVSILLWLIGGFSVCCCIRFFDDRMVHLKARQYDEMTSCFNRYGLEFFILPQITEALQKGLPVSVIAFDGDNFKSINDTYGHSVGDQVICHIADSIRRASRHTDFLVRSGGDEFLLFCINATYNDALNTVDRLNISISENNPFFPQSLNKKKITISSGVAQFMEEETLTDCMKHADMKMYLNKEGKKKEGKQCLPSKPTTQKDA